MKHATAALLALLLSGFRSAAPPPATYTGYGDPSKAEQHVLEMINRARLDPFAEGTRLGIDIREGLAPSDAALVTRRPPLVLNAKLSSAALSHNQDMWTRSYFAHDAPAPTPSTPPDRMIAAGYSPDSWGENIAGSSSDTAAGLEDLLMVDAGISGRGHRKNLLHIYSWPTFREIGISYFDGGAVNGQNLRDFLTQDFATDNSSGPFVVGIVYDDKNSNGFFDLTDDGIAGAVITPSTGSFQGQSATNGGYAFPTGTSGTLTLTVTGITWAPTVVKKVVLAGENVKVDFIKADGVDTDGDGMPDEWEIKHGFNPNGPFGDLTEANADADGDGTTNLEEFQYGSDPGDPNSTKTNPHPFTVPPPGGGGGGGGTSGGHGGCGSTGLDLLWIGLLPLLRRLSLR